MQLQMMKSVEINQGKWPILDGQSQMTSPPANDWEQIYPGESPKNLKESKKGMIVIGCLTMHLYTLTSTTEQWKCGDYKDNKEYGRYDVTSSSFALLSIP